MVYFAKVKKQKDSSYLVEFPELPGCLTEGRNKVEALKNAKEALDGWLEVNCNHNLNIQAPVRRKGSAFYPIEVDLNIAFSVQLRLLRADLGVTQAEAAKKLKISQQAYAKLESARTANPSLSTIKKIAISFQVSVLRLVS